MKTEVSKTKMIAGETRTVTLEVTRRVDYDGKTLEPGARIDVDFEKAKELVKLSVEGVYDFSGEVDKIAKKPRIFYFRPIVEKTPESELLSAQMS
jgi:hypothetical protein